MHKNDEALPTFSSYFFFTKLMGGGGGGGAAERKTWYIPTVLHSNLQSETFLAGLDLARSPNFT